ncbi:MAG: hypothetical protein ACKVJK_10135 [Methylophagaceae bacterium]|jgi:hypothetical protein
MENWMFLITAVVFTGFGFYAGRESSIYYDVKLITQNVIDQLEDHGFIHKIINDDGEEELVLHPGAVDDRED